MITPQAQAWFDWLQVALGIGVVALAIAFVVMLLGVGWYFRFHAGDDLAKENLTLRQRLEAAEKDARRYRFLRGEEDSPRRCYAYWPEEMGVWGGKELDDKIDAALAAGESET